MLEGFKEVKFLHVPRGINQTIDAMDNNTYSLSLIYIWKNGGGEIVHNLP
jgi:hypothetical protein